LWLYRRCNRHSRDRRPWRQCRLHGPHDTHNFPRNPANRSSRCDLCRHIHRHAGCVVQVHPQTHSYHPSNVRCLAGQFLFV
jgi:hypothetical protein